MKLKIALIVVTSILPMAAQNKSLPADILAGGDKALLIPDSDSLDTLDPFQEPIDFTLDDAPLNEVFKYIATEVPNPPQVVFKDQAGELTVTASLKNVTLENFLTVLENLVDCKITIVDTNKSDNHPGIVFIAPKPSASQLFTALNDEETYRTTPFGSTSPAPRALPIPSPTLSEDELRQEGLGPNHPAVRAAAKAPTTPIARTYSLANFDKISPTEIMDAIFMLWDSSDPDWTAKSGKQAFSMHEPTKTLIIRAPLERHEEASGLVTQLSNTFHSKDDASLEKAEAMKMRSILIQEENDRLGDQLAHLMRQLQEREVEIVQLKARLTAMPSDKN